MKFILQIPEVLRCVKAATNARIAPVCIKFLFVHSWRVPRQSLIVAGFAISFLMLLGNVCRAQSTLADFPTPITTNELSGTIKARDVGDARLTTYYYWFEGSQGDVFINLVAKNFAGDVDIFLQNGLRLLTKIAVYPDFGEVETGRVIYLRKPEKLLVRVQGRTPNDEAAQFRMKFAGSFVAASGSTDVPEIPKVSDTTTGSVRVNSVGTILPPPPKPVKTETETAETAVTVDTEKKDEETEKAKTPVEKDEAAAEKVEKEVPKLEVVVSDNTPKETAKTAAPAKTTRPPRRTRNTRSTGTKKAAEVPVKTETETVEKAVAEDTASSESTKPPEKETPADPLANVQLVILFKDGSKIERPLNEVFRFSVDRGVLTVVSKQGRVGKYQMVNVSKVTIE